MAIKEIAAAAAAARESQLELKPALQPFDDRCLQGRVVLVTGASSGLGRAAAIALSQKGAKLIVTGRDADRLSQTRDMLTGADHEALLGVIGDADSAAELVKSAARAVGVIDGIFHAAGSFSVLPVKVTKQRHLEEAFGASVFGAFGIARAAANRTVLSDGGSIVFMSSVAGERASSGLTAYAGAKAAISGLCRSLAAELAPRRIRVNMIVASTIETEMHERTLSNADMDYVEMNRARHPLGFGRPADVTNAALFLLSDASRWVTGSALTVDGGYLA
jgi:NAD(P)-dependent dehydrogenase (short-subunit alcohol dehydrogenase family)